MSETNPAQKYLQPQAPEASSRHWLSAKWVLAFVVGASTAVFLFLPYLEAVPPVLPVVPPRAALPPVDLYFLRDASASPNFEDYQRIEDDIFRHVDTRLGDRVSFASFGGVNDPLDIQPASRAPATLVAARKVSKSCRFATTDFARLFTELRRSLVKDRAADPFDVQRQEVDHQDLVVILSDGVHDPANWSHHCPDEFAARGREFVPPEVREAFTGLALIPGTKVRVYLVIAGEDQRCTPSIRSEWLLALGGAGLEVLTFGEADSGSELGTRVFEALDRSRATLVQPFTPELNPEQRARLDRNQEFWLEYRFRPILAATEIKILEARLDEISPPAQTPGPREKSQERAPSIPLSVRLRPSSNYDAGPVDFSPLSIALAEPRGNLIGESVDKVLYFQRKNDVDPGYSPEKRYSLRLILESDGCQVLQDEVLLPPHHDTLVSADLRRRVIWVTTCYALLAIFGWITQGLLRRRSIAYPWAGLLRPSIRSALLVMFVAILFSKYFLSVIYVAMLLLSTLPRHWLWRKITRLNLDAYRDWLEFFLPNAITAWWF